MNFFENNKRSLPEAVTVMAFSLVFNETVYCGTRLITTSMHHYDMTTPLDRMLPFLPWTVLIYFGCFVMWGLIYYLCAVQNRRERDRFYCADIIAKAAVLLCFILIPTTNVRPEIVDDNIWGFLMSFLYKIDPADNLFPSLHCLVSWMCWIGIRKRKDISPVYRYLTLTAVIAVCISTVTTKQHVIADVIGGVLLAELSYLAAGIPKVCAVYSAVISRVMKVFGVRIDEKADRT